MAGSERDGPKSGFGRLVAAADAAPGGGFDAEALLVRAEAEAGRRISLDALARDGLSCLSQDLAERGTSLSFLGRKFLQRALIDTLLKRAALTDVPLATRADPAPVFIVAPFRSGTTFLHRLLAQDARFRWLATWEVSQPPGQPGDEAAQIDAVARYIGHVARLSPDLGRLHPTDAMAPEECFGLLEPSFLSLSFLFWAPLPRYAAWLRDRTVQDWTLAYGHYAAGLRLRAARRDAGGQRWLLKSPFHLCGLDGLMAAFPDARIVQLNRPAEAVMRTTAALLEANRSVFAPPRPPGETGVPPETVTEAASLMQHALTRALAARAAIPTGQMLYLNYADLVRAPLETAEQIGRWLGLVPESGVRARQAEWLATANAAPTRDPDRAEPTSVTPSIPAAFAEYARHAPAKGSVD